MNAGEMTEQDTRIMAALAHISVILPFMGVIAPIVIWATQREKSHFVAFQALQALVYQLTMIIGWFIGMGCYAVSFLGMFLGIFAIPFAADPQAEGAGIFVVILTMLGSIIPFLVFGVIILVFIAFLIYGLVGAISTFQGKDFRYIIIGRWLERYLERENKA
ncbi:MAG: DUF4870 domain-containing protein [Anaerolineae bacterium]